VQGDLAVVNCMVGPDIGSDHLPIIVDLHVSPE
jgi:endonuclease/exonuclease/phosphatase (EEP) superfamily protein YafD